MTIDPVDGTTELRWHVVTEVTVDDVTDMVDGIIGLTLHAVMQITGDDVTGMVIADDITKGREQ